MGNADIPEETSDKDDYIPDYKDYRNVLSLRRQFVCDGLAALLGSASLMVKWQLAKTEEERSSKGYLEEVVDCVYELWRVAFLLEASPCNYWTTELDQEVLGARLLEKAAQLIHDFAYPTEFRKGLEDRPTDAGKVASELFSLAVEFREYAKWEMYEDRLRDTDAQQIAAGQKRP